MFRKAITMIMPAINNTHIFYIVYNDEKEREKETKRKESNSLNLK